MDMEETWLAALRVWAAANDSVAQLWLFGSRARGTSRPDSDVDLALALMPPAVKHDWALGNHVVCKDEWKRQLEAIVGRHVSLEAIIPGTPEDARTRRDGICLWKRL
jgi:predicted nucleotidyltransferase